MKKKLYLCCLLHFYQPPTQDFEILKKIDLECYQPLLRTLINSKNIKITLNINGVLLDMLHQNGFKESILSLKKLLEENKIEITGTAKYHPILPLIPLKEIKHQIEINEEALQNYFGFDWKKIGFFPPEMAVSRETIKIVRELKYKWIIMSGIACPEKWPNNKIYESTDGLQMFFRDDLLSNKISFQNISVEDLIINLKEMCKSSSTEKSYVLLAQDAETFGHHIPHYEKIFLSKLFKLIDEEQEIKMTFISDLDKDFPISNKNITPKSSSWSTTSDDLCSGVPYPLWKHPENDVHRYYWKIMKSLHKLIEMADELDLTKSWDVENHYNTARWFYDRGIYSCPAWWANSLKGMWSPNLIYKGVEILMRAALNAQLALEYGGNEESENYFDAITYYHGLLLMELYNITKKSQKSH